MSNCCRCGVRERTSSRAYCAECARTYHAEWYQRNKAKRAVQSRAWIASNRGRFAALQANYYSTNKTSIAAKRAARLALTPGYSLKSNHRRRARMNGVEDTLTTDQWHVVVESFGARCGYCGAAHKRLAMDHVEPISRGGANTAQNVIPACKSCNSKKGARGILSMLSVEYQHELSSAS